MTRRIPNIISAIAILLGVGGLYFGAFEGNVRAALLCTAGGGVLQVADGYAADRLKAYLGLGELLQSLAGLAIGIGVVATLVRAGAWSWWFVAALIILVVLLQVVSWQQIDWPRLKRVQNWLHPVLSASVTIWGIVTMGHLISDNWVLYTIFIMMLSVFVCLALAVRRQRVLSWFQWEPETLHEPAVTD